MEKNSYAKHWSYTINNPEVDVDKKKFEEYSDTLYNLCQLERGEDGTLHLQGAIGFKKQKYFNALKRLHPRAHWEVTRSVPRAIAYCRKPETRVEGPWEFGDIPVGSVQGKRTDNDQYYKAIREGKSITELYDMNPGLTVRNLGNTLRFQSYVTPPRDFPSRVYIFCGPTGTGKTTAALKKFPTPFKTMCPKHGNLWFDGYEPMFHQTVVIDDFYGGIKWSDLLQMVDSHPYRVQVKGATVQFRPQTIIFTSNAKYKEWYPNMDVDPFTRRIEDFGGVVMFPKDGTPWVELGKMPPELVDPLPNVLPSPDPTDDSDEESQPHNGNHQEIGLNSPPSETE